MFAPRCWAQFALVLNLVGTVLLFYSFNASASGFRLGDANYGNHKLYALCLDHDALFATDSTGRVGFGMGMEPCPSWAESKPAAIVNTEHPNFVGWGFGLIGVGFLIQLIQLFSVPEPASIEDLREQIRLQKKLRAVRSPQR